MSERNIEQMEISGRTLKEMWNGIKWAKLLGLISIAFYFIMVLLSIFGGLLTAVLTPMLPFGGFIQTLLMIVFYTITLLIPGLLLYNFASHTKNAIVKNDDELAYLGFKRFRQLFQYAGIITLASLLLSGISIVVLVVASVF